MQIGTDAQMIENLLEGLRYFLVQVGFLVVPENMPPSQDPVPKLSTKLLLMQ
jgi:hypothetical protein